MERETKKEFQNLGRMIKKGFDHVDKRFDNVDKRFNKVNGRLDILEQGQEEIKLKLDNVAYRFELKELEERFEKRLHKIELKLGLPKS